MLASSQSGIGLKDTRESVLERRFYDGESCTRVYRAKLRPQNLFPESIIATSTIGL